MARENGPGAAAAQAINGVSWRLRSQKKVERSAGDAGIAPRCLAAWGIVLMFALASCGRGETEAERNKVIESMRSRPLTYVAIGASDTVGIGAQNPSLESWVAILSSRLPSDTRFVRLGVSGSTAAEAVRAQLPAAKVARPDVVTIWLAGNDFSMNVPLEEYEKSLTEIIQGLKGEGEPRIFVGNLPDLTTVPAYLTHPRQALAEKLNDWNQTIARVARENGAFLVDLHATSKAVGPANIGLTADDGFHPSTQGYKVIADAFWRSMMEDPVLSAVLEPRSQASLTE